MQQRSRLDAPGRGTGLVPLQRLQALLLARQRLPHVGRGGGGGSLDLLLRAHALVVGRQVDEQRLRHDQQRHQRAPQREAAAARAGIARDHVIGIRAMTESGKMTYGLQGCGDFAGGTGPDKALITYMDGKRCWINKVIFGVDSPAAIQRATDPQRRPVLVAGDSDTDLSMVQDATGIRLVINRNKKELMCNAYHNAGGNWLINPMFIQPRAQQMTAYPCSTTACLDAAGVGTPCKDEGGATIPDQMDTVF